MLRKRGKDMKAYMVAFVRVHDLEAYKKTYLMEAHPLIMEFGGKSVMVSNKLTKLSGDLPSGKFVILEFPDLEKAKAYYYCDAHQQLLKAGQKYFDADSIIVENELPVE